MRVTAPTGRSITRWGRRFYGRWVAANTVAEVFGLGATGVLVAGFAARLESLSPALLAGVMVASGTLLEGVLVGGLQAWVLRTALPRFSVRAWTGATALGAGVAWLLGALPSTLLSFEGGEPVPEPGPGLVALLAALMGAALGPVLAAPQWLELRRHVTRAAWWIPANAFAWALGMVLVFAGVDLMMASESLALRALIGAASLAFTGASVGAVHGLALVTLITRYRRSGHSPRRGAGQKG